MDLIQGDVPKYLKPLFKAIAIIIFSTSECERNVRTMNEIISPLRTSLSIQTVTALLFTNCLGPLKEYVKYWLLKNKR